jgi:drug/metabolite transporter (DMT)-like permease
VTYSLPMGMRFAVVFGLAIGTGYTLISRVTRSLDPLVAGYCWESTITVMGAVVLLLRRLAWGRIGTVPSRRDLARIVLFCIPGAVGTSCYALAVAGGPIAIVSAVLSTMMVVSSILAWLMYGEKLSRGQWLLVAFVCGAVVGMRFASG